MAQNQAVCAAGASGGVLGPVLRRISKLCGLRQVSSCLKLACDFQNKPGGNCLCCVRLGAHAVHSEALRCAGGALRPSSQRWPIRFVDVLRFKVASCPPAAPSPQSNASDDIREHPARTLMQLKTPVWRDGHISMQARQHEPDSEPMCTISSAIAEATVQHLDQEPRRWRTAA